MNSSNSNQYNEELYRTIKEAYTCTEEDLKFQFTKEQLKEICLKHKCRVIASRWNIVHEYGLWLRKEGRFEGRSPSYERGMIAKGVNRHKHKLMYDEETIKKTLEQEWRDRKKDNILSVRMWERERNAAVSADLSLETNSNRNENSASEFDILENLLDISTIDTETEEDIQEAQTQNDAEDEHLEEEYLEEEHLEEEHLEEEHLEEEILVEKEIELRSLQNSPKAMITDSHDDIDATAGMNLTSKERGKELHEVFDINTESLTLTHSFSPTQLQSQSQSQLQSQLQSQSQSLPQLQSQSENLFTEEFESGVPCTSTQKDSEVINAC